ncbi:MAG TPA: YggS family pyridoxal phosphate-dependent enzyme [Erysipelotrichaceae bacterium]|nr:YggS family pyridoxal phosphate-dependent enzyme [Erysipelotrichaceae bacterium]
MNHQEYRIKYPNIHEIVAVSKTFDLEAINRVYDQGFRHFGENKVQELKGKAPFKSDIKWHFIGHLQSNKVKDCVRFADAIDAVDSIELIDAIERECLKLQKGMPILIQLKLTDEVTKAGVTINQVEELIEQTNKCQFVHCDGLMVIGPNTEDMKEIDRVFGQAQQLFQDLKKKYPQLRTLSMGMSHDYEIAYQNGATQFRLGSILFGQRSPK